ncbi:hypothetical protein G2W53_039940 [Senna tora]|uniref:Uncharacterized protein n=1 Tax=Senna tora TaxID=362788 RepID=A0A834T224_9FABA|nr:hypothetical protein G2W53_039940 [Senna tora]
MVVTVKKLVVGRWVGSIGPPLVCTGRLFPSVGDALLALIGRVVPPRRVHCLEGEKKGGFGFGIGKEAGVTVVGVVKVWGGEGGWVKGDGFVLGLEVGSVLRGMGEGLGYGLVLGLRRVKGGGDFRRESRRKVWWRWVTVLVRRVVRFWGGEGEMGEGGMVGVWLL